jgi:ferrous iron transport protein B
MNNTRWTLFAIGYQCGFAYAVSFCIYQIGSLFTAESLGFGNVIGVSLSVLIIAFALFMIFRPARSSVKKKNEK